LPDALSAPNVTLLLVVMSLLCIVEELPIDCWETMLVAPVPTVFAPNATLRVSLKVDLCMVAEEPMANFVMPL